MNYTSIITKLYFILIYADGRVDEKEIASGNRMIKSESIPEEDFNIQLQYLKSKDTSFLLAECLAGLKKLDRKQQVRIIAWLCVVANADGFMDTAEWKLIYMIYSKELNLSLDEIFKVQKELNGLAHEKSTLMSGLRSIAQ
jgi:uncharacterized tellurite resistance protein B-like protein